jgi:Holliday junction resolvase RusA-like endonuclease
MPSARYSPADCGLTLRHTMHVTTKLISKSNHKLRYLPKKYREFEDHLAWLAGVVCSRPMHKGPGWVVIRPCFKTRSHVDPNNLPKSIMDALKKGGVYTDDKAWAVTVMPVCYCEEPSIIEIWA